MRISIVILNYNGSEETIRLLKSLKEQVDQDFEIIVVDNASEETDFGNLQNQLIHIFSFPTSQVVQAVYPQVIRNDMNLGFSGGNNTGIKQALKNGSDWIVLLNNDTWTENGFIKYLKAILSLKTGIVGIPLVEENYKSPVTNHKLTAYCGRIRWLKSTLEHIKDSRFTVVHINDSKFYAIGAALAVQRDVFKEFGLLDEKYFLYFEDADFSVRAKKAKIPISIQYDIMIYHTVSSSTKKLGSPLLLRYHYRNALYFNRKNGPWYIKLLVWPWSLIIVIKQLGKLVIKKNTDQSRAILSGVMDFYKNKMGRIR